MKWNRSCHLCLSHLRIAALGKQQRSCWYNSSLYHMAGWGMQKLWRDGVVDAPRPDGRQKDQLEAIRGLGIEEKGIKLSWKKSCQTNLWDTIAWMGKTALFQNLNKIEYNFNFSKLRSSKVSRDNSLRWDWQFPFMNWCNVCHWPHNAIKMADWHNLGWRLAALILWNYLWDIWIYPGSCSISHFESDSEKFSL